MEPADLDGGATDAAGRAMDQHLHAGLEAGAHHEGLLHGKEGLGQGGAGDEAPALWQRQHLAGGNGDIFGIAAAIAERDDLLAGADDFARDF